MRSQQAYLAPSLQFPSFQALCKADVVSVWVVLLHLASPTCLCGQLSILSVCAYIPIGNTCSDLLVDEVVDKIAAAALPLSELHLSGYRIWYWHHM